MLHVHADKTLSEIKTPGQKSTKIVTHNIKSVYQNKTRLTEIEKLLIKHFGSKKLIRNNTYEYEKLCLEWQKLKQEGKLKESK